MTTRPFGSRGRGRFQNPRDSRPERYGRRLGSSSDCTLAKARPDRDAVPGQKRGDQGQEHWRAWKAALVLVEVVLGDPRRVEATPLGMDDLVDFNCVSAQEQGTCTFSTCGHNLLNFKESALERRKHDKLGHRPFNRLLLSSKHS